jgi:23S rRNA A2030 N6-methylase RlmJ
MSDRVIGYGQGGKFGIVVVIGGSATKSDVENLVAEIRQGARRVGLTTRIVWSPKKGRKKRKKK